jgi:hypothetical protein
MARLPYGPLAGAVGAVAFAGACATSGFPEECRLDEPTAPGLGAPVDLTAAKAYRSYAAVTAVEPAGHHFTVWYDDEEPVMLRLRVTREATGRLTLVVEGGGEGGFSEAPLSLPPPPAEVAALARDLESTLRSRCRSVKRWKIEYRGLTRTVRVEEFIAHDPDARGTRRAGWKVGAELAMDPALTHIIDRVEHWSGFGVIEVPGAPQWLPLPEADGSKLRLAWDTITNFSPEIAEGARRFAAHAPSPPLASLVPADAPMLPAGFASRVIATVALMRREAPGLPGKTAALRAPLDLHDAVFGSAADAAGETTLGGRRYRLHATLVPGARRDPRPGRASATYAGTLTLHVEDDAGHTWGRAYTTSGKIELEGDQVVAPAGLQIPGASSPTPESEARHGRMPAEPPSPGVELEVGVELFDEPRR